MKLQMTAHNIHNLSEQVELDEPFVVVIYNKFLINYTSKTRQAEERRKY
jgi:hypothetical protein